jgi:predicted dehydrogenase
MTVAPDPREAPPIRWGILGAGHIASRFVTAVQQHTQGQVVAVGSRDRERGAAFAAAHRIGTGHRIGAVHEGYAALVADPAVDVVYVATPHSEHREHALLAIAAGKHVLVEKAFTRNAHEAVEVIQAARAAGVFLMEAMWTRFLPHVAALRQVVERGEIGDVVRVEADFGGSPPYNPTDRNFNLALAGGALLDLGVYPIAFAQDLLGTPTGVTAVGTLAGTGVDVESTVTLGFEGRAEAIARSSFLADTPRTAVVIGTDGRIDVDPEFYAPTTFTVTRRDGTRTRFEEPVEGGMQFEAAEVARCVAEGRVESPRMTWQSTLDVMRTLDAARARLGVVYPGE